MGKIKILTMWVIIPLCIFALGNIDLSNIYIESVNRSFYPGRIKSVECNYIAWSPDDKMIFFHDHIDRENYLLDLTRNAWIPLKTEKPEWINGEAKRIALTMKELSYSPDGLLGVRFRKEDKELEIFRSDDPTDFIVPIVAGTGKTFAQTGPVVNGGTCLPAWSHNGKYIAVYSKVGDWGPDHWTVVLTIVGYSPQVNIEAAEETGTKQTDVNAPKITYVYSLIDENIDKVLCGGEKVSLKVIVRNEGEGTAQGVKVLLSGESKTLKYLGREKFIGDIPPGGEKDAVFEAVLPYKIEPDNANLIIRVTEEKGFDALKETELLIAMQPAKVEREREVISTLVDVDQQLSPISFRRDDAYAVIIGITDYRSVKIPKVKYAKRDAETVRDYLVNICGFPSQNIMMLTDEKAAKSDFEAYIEEWLARNVTKNSFVFVYFAGHGTPNPEKGDAYLVPYDGEPGFISKLYPLSRFYNSLEKLPTDNIVVALDACFSGAGGRSVIEEGKRPLVVAKIEEESKKVSKAVIITASAADEISQDLDAKRHGLFTYYFLKGMRGEADVNADNWITLGELYDYCKPKIKEESRKLGYTQTPKVFPEPLGEKANLKIGKIK